MRINYEQKGRGDKAIVLLHGWSKEASLKSLSKVQDALVKLGFTTIAIDLPGFGKSSAAPTHWGVHEYAEAIYKLIHEELRLENYILFGHSFGGSLGVYISANFENKPEKLVLCSSSGLRYKTRKAKLLLPLSKFLKVFLKILPRSPRRKVKKFVYYYVIRERDYIDTSGNREQFLRVTGQDLGTHFENLRVPTLIIWGRRDKITPLAMANKLNTLIVNSKLKVVEGRHGIPFTNSDEIAQEVNQFAKTS